MNSGTVFVTGYRKKKAIINMSIVIPSGKDQGSEIQQRCCLAIQSQKRTFVCDELLYFIKNIHITDYNDVVRLAQLGAKRKPAKVFKQKRHKQTSKKETKKHSAGIKSSWGCGCHAPTYFMSGGCFTPR